MAIIFRITPQLNKLDMCFADIADRVRVTPEQLALLESGQAAAIRLSTLDNLCQILQCQPGDLLKWAPGEHLGADWEFPG